MKQTDAAEEVAQIGLHYSNDQQPGITRKPVKHGFRYFDGEGRAVSHAAALDRISKLVIPPAWIDVWICKSPRGYLQATGRDAKGRKQAIYHTEWLAHQGTAKFERMSEFGRALPKLRKRVEADLAQHGLPKSKIVAAVVQLLELSLIRIGNRQYARDNESFGLTTLENRHAKVTSTSVKFSFKGKSGKFHEILLADRRLASIVRRCRELPGQALFEYCDDGSQPSEITSTDVNDYIHNAAGIEFTAKDFRTWAATVEAVRLLKAIEDPSERDVKDVVKQVAKKLGNTPAVCRASYIHPIALDLSAKWHGRPVVGQIERFVLKYVLR